MKYLSLFITLTSLLFSSCDKKATTDSTPQTIAGSWRMVTVKDNTTGELSTKPDSIQGNVDLTFTLLTDTSGTYTGHTPANVITVNPFSIGIDHRLTIPTVGMSYAMESSWGFKFVDNICQSQKYNFESENRLVIVTSSKTLTFHRQ